MHFIDLTGTDGNILTVTIEAITYRRPAPGGTSIHFVGGEEVIVAQTVAEVRDAINDALK
jgi:uncharacterized protein YlzI (FlbEa/FlbD family)